MIGFAVSHINEKRLIYFDNEEHLVRRLGAAVVVCWTELDRRDQDKLIDRAERVLDEAEAGHFERQLRHLIEEHGRKL